MHYVWFLGDCVGFWWGFWWSSDGDLGLGWMLRWFFFSLFLMGYEWSEWLWSLLIWWITSSSRAFLKEYIYISLFNRRPTFFPSPTTHEPCKFVHRCVRSIRITKNRNTKDSDSTSHKPFVPSWSRVYRSIASCGVADHAWERDLKERIRQHV